jgi:hypothetical protein
MREPGWPHNLVDQLVADATSIAEAAQTSCRSVPVGDTNAILRHAKAVKSRGAHWE